MTLLTTTGLWLRRGQMQEQTFRLTIPAVTPQYRMIARWSGGLRVSPDGKRVAFVAAPVGQDETVLWVRSLDSFDAKSLEGTKGADQPFWSPDSRQIGFFAHDELKIVSADGGVIQSVAKVGPGAIWGATWSANEGGARFSPDGKWIAFSSDEPGKDQIYVQPFPGPGQKIQISTDGGVMPRWSKDGRRLSRLLQKQSLARAKSCPRLIIGLNSLWGWAGRTNSR